MRKFLIILACLGLGGCALMPPRIGMSIDAISNNESYAGKSCAITSGIKDISPDDLQFQEFSGDVKRALIMKGYTVSDDLKTADITLYLSYAISEPMEHQRVFSSPVFGQTGVSSANTMGTISSNGYNANLMATTTYTPTYGVVGTSVHSRTIVTYKRQIILDAYDAKKEKEIWKTQIESIGRSGDLRRVFPVLLAGAVPYIGGNTGQKVTVVLGEDNNEVLAIKGAVTTQSASH